jgi:1-aminocyclopropane-1-carboxylate synthase
MDTCFEPSVVEAFEAALQKANAEGVRIKALLITNPHNPLGKFFFIVHGPTNGRCFLVFHGQGSPLLILNKKNLPSLPRRIPYNLAHQPPGRCYPPATLIALQQFCQKHKIHFISDEIYALSVFDSKESGAHPFTSVFSVEQHIDPDRLHVIYGFSKDYGAPGLRLGALITRSEALRNAFTAMIRFHNPSGASVAIATAMLQDTDWMDGFLATSRKRVEEAYMFITKRLGEMGVRYAEGTNAGLFVFVDLSPWLIEDRGQGQEAREQELARRAFDKGLGLQPGEEHAREVGWFRLVYTLDRGIVDEGLRR